MEIEDHYSQLLGIRVPWEISKVELDMSAHRVDIEIEYTGVTGACPECGANCPKHDDRKQRSWRHLDTMQFAIYLHCSVPRVRCKKHGARTVNVPWAGKHSRFTLLFEGFAVRVLQAVTMPFAMQDGPGVTLTNGMPGPFGVDWSRSRKRPE